MTDSTADWPAPDDRNRQHWLIERRLREELLASSPEDRDEVTQRVYDRLFELVPWHKANTREAADEDAYEDYWVRLYGPLAGPGATVVDLGCGRGGLVRRFASAVPEAIGIDVSDAMIALAEQGRPANARFEVGSVVAPPLPPESADLVISRQVMEHLHPDDVPGHLAAVLRILRPGGRFLVETPSGLTGPWDISRGFTATATGFHLHEYTNGELAGLMRRAGFARVTSPALPSRLAVRLPDPLRGRAYVPVAVKAAIEWVLGLLPAGARLRLSGPLVVREVLLVGQKAGARPRSR